MEMTTIMMIKKLMMLSMDEQYKKVNRKVVVDQEGRHSGVTLC